MLTAVKVLRHLLHEEMLDERAFVDLACSRSLPGVISGLEALINSFSPHYLSVLEVRFLLKKEIIVARLLEVEVNGEHRPETVVHPDSRDTVTVSDELAPLGADDGRIGAVRPDTCKIAHQVFSRLGRVS